VQSGQGGLLVPCCVVCILQEHLRAGPACPLTDGRSRVAGLSQGKQGALTVVVARVRRGVHVQTGQGVMPGKQHSIVAGGLGLRMGWPPPDLEAIADTRQWPLVRARPSAETPGA